MSDGLKNNIYKDWDILQEIPEGWIIDKTVGSPLFDCVFITNGKSVINGQKRALLRIKSSPINKTVQAISIPAFKKDEIDIPKIEELPFPAKTVNALARMKFQEQLLKEIMFDLMVCEIEGWDKREYIRQIRKLINGIDISNNSKNKLTPNYQITIFN